MMDEHTILIVAVAAAICFIVILAWLFLRKQKPKRKHSPYIEALNALLANDRQTALQKLRETVKIDSQNVDAYLKLGNLLREEGDVERALKIHKSLTVRPLSPVHRRDVLKAVASDYLADGKMNQARTVAGNILSINKRDLWAHETLLHIYEETNQWEKAFEMQKQVQRLKGQEDKELLALYKVYAGQSLDHQGEHHKARLKYKEALRIDERCTAAYLFLGDSYVAEHRLNDAIIYWKKLMETVPEHAFLCFERLEKTQFELGDYSSMIQIYKHLIAGKPEDLGSLFAFVRIQEKMGHIDEAIALCQDTLERHPTSQEARWCLVRCYHSKGDDDQAMKYALDLEKSYSGGNGFSCHGCGYQATDIHWRCPQCKAWRTFLTHDA